MIKNILWDFDGVILDSMKIKGDGFVELFASYNKEEVKKLEEYHYMNGGISRFEKIKYFFYNILEQDISETEILKLADNFACIIKSNLFNKSNLINESIDFIKENYKKYNFHIVSGAEHNEVNQLCDYFELSDFFISIEGSPTKKSLLIENILIKHSYFKQETILIGDSINDYIAANENNIEFYGFNNSELIKFNYINKFIDWNINDK